MIQNPSITESVSAVTCKAIPLDCSAGQVKSGLSVAIAQLSIKAIHNIINKEGDHTLWWQNIEK